MSAQDGKPVWSVVFASPNPSDLIVVDAYRLGFSVSAGNLASDAPQLAAEVRHLIGGNATRRGPQDTKIGGLPSVRFQVAGVAGKGHVTSTVIFTFEGTTE